MPFLFYFIFFSSLFLILTYIKQHLASTTIQRRTRARDFSLSQPTLSTPIFHYHIHHFVFIQKDEQHAGRQEIEGKERMACSSSWFRG